MIPIEEQRLGDRIEQLNNEVKAWAKITRQKLLFRLASLGLKERVRLADELELRKSVRSKIGKKQGELEKVAFTFARHGIFLEHGVGKGRKVDSAKANSAKKPWLSAVIPNSLEELADLLENEYADLAAGELSINIPGVFESSVKL